MVKIVLRNIIRHKKNIILLFTVIFSVVLINSYVGNILSNRRQLRELADATPIYCYITNLSGSKMAGLDIKEDAVRKLIQSDHTRDAAYTVRVMGGVGDIPESEWKKLVLNVLGANRIEAVSGLQRENIEWEGDIDSFFESAENLALVAKDVMDQYGLKDSVNNFSQNQFLPSGCR